MAFSVISILISLFITLSPISQSIEENSACNIVFNGIDLTTKDHRIEIGRELLFQFTPKEIKSELQTSNLINTKGQIVQINDLSALHLNIRIASKIAPQHYGTVEEGNIMKVTLLDGKIIELPCYAGSIGIPTKDQSGYIYPLGFTLEQKTLKQLSRLEIDKIGIQWSSGYEEYPIYEVDFFIKQIACLNHAQNSN